MTKIVKNSWALFAGIGIMMIAHGLQGNLMGVRSVIEEFNFLATGTMMSGYYVGYFFGSRITPKLVLRVGHIRVFAAFASMASLSILIISAYVNPIVWTFARFITGISVVSCFVVAESWLNDRANNNTRGKILSIYMIFQGFRACDKIDGNYILQSRELKANPKIFKSTMIILALLWAGNQSILTFIRHKSFAASLAWAIIFGVIALVIYLEKFIEKSIPDGAQRHRKLGRITMVIFALILVTSTLVYLMLYVVYPKT